MSGGALILRASVGARSVLQLKIGWKMRMGRFVPARDTAQGCSLLDLIFFLWIISRVAVAGPLAFNFAEM